MKIKASRVRENAWRRGVENKLKRGRGVKKKRERDPFFFFFRRAARALFVRPCRRKRGRTSHNPFAAADADADAVRAEETIACVQQYMYVCGTTRQNRVAYAQTPPHLPLDPTEIFGFAEKNRRFGTIEFTFFHSFVIKRFFFLLK